MPTTKIVLNAEGRSERQRGGVTSRDEFVTWQTNEREEERKKPANKNENGQLTFICIFKFLDIARGNFVFVAAFFIARDI